MHQSLKLNGDSFVVLFQGGVLITELSLGHDVRGFVGYTGWSEGQLEKEIKQRSWILTTARKTILTTPRPEVLWTSILEEMGPVYQVIAHIPEKVELN